MALATSIGSGAFAADFDGSKRLLCVPIEAVECTVAEDCLRSSSEALDIPQFVRVDFGAKTLSGTVATGGTRTTAIQNVQMLPGRTVLQGAENGRAWSIVIDQASGKMSVAISDIAEDGDRAGFILFGACTPD